jgi:hypothetical protein
MTRKLPLLLALVSLLLVSGLGARAPQGAGSDSGGTPQGTASDRRAAEIEVRPAQPQPQASVASPEAAPLFNLNWYSVNGGGDIHLTGARYDLGISAGQPATGALTGSTYKLGMGFWYGVACPIGLSGDVNLNSSISTSDIIAVVNYALKAGPEPLPCIANADANCSGSISLADIIVLINFVLKAGPPPCNVCDIIPSLWSCP